MSTANQIPVFGEGGRRLDSGTQANDSSAYLAGEPTAIFRDPASELAAGFERFDETYRRLYPALKSAHDLRDRRKLAVQEWAVRACELDKRVADLRNLVNRGSLSSEDSIPGTRAERMAAAIAAQRETREEFCAAVEELRAAEAVVEVELAKTPMGAL